MDIYNLDIKWQLCLIGQLDSKGIKARIGTDDELSGDLLQK